MLKVLLVDDDIAVSRCFIQLIDWKSLGYSKIFTALNGAQAYEIAKREKVDVVVSDLKMPMMSGVELTRKLRENKIDSEVILLTAYEDFSAAREGIELKIYDYLLKPIVKETVERLSEDLEKIARKRRKAKWAENFMKDEFDEEILQAFRKCDTKYIKNLFEKIHLLGSDSEKKQSFHLVIVKLIGVLSSYLCELGFSDVSIEFNRKKLLEITKHNNSNKEIADVLHSRILDFITNYDDLSGNREPIDRISEIKSYIHKNYMRSNFCVDEIAKVFYYSPDHINRIFKRSEGVTASKYITMMKMNKARQMILNTDMSIKEIAKKVGYSSESYFVSSFKKNYGIAPSEFRKKSRNLERSFKFLWQE